MTIAKIIIGLVTLASCIGIAIAVSIAVQILGLATFILFAIGTVLTIGVCYLIGHAILN